jgi:hypothetical protein
LAKAAIGGVIGGVVGSIPLVGGLLACCLCLPNVLGIGIGMNMHFKSSQGDRFSIGEGAIFGGMAGVIAGLITGVLNFVINLVLGTALAGLYKSLPSNVRDQLIARTAGGVIGIFTTPIFYGIWGVLAGIVLLSTVFKTNKAG